LKYWEVFTIDKKTGDGYKKKKARKSGKEDYKLQNADRIRLGFNVYRNIWLEPDESEEKDGKTTKYMGFGLSRCKASFWSRKNDIDGRSWDGSFYAIQFLGLAC
jgi:hypothetical protein